MKSLFISWDKIFCPNDYGGKTRAELTPEQNDATYTTIKPIAKLQKFLKNPPSAN